MSNPQSRNIGEKPMQVAAVVFAAGKGSRMTGYSGNKTLLPLVPASTVYEGEQPLLVQVLKNLPAGPKGVVVRHCADQVKKATEAYGVSYIVQPATNGTGGAILASRAFLESVEQEAVIITMGDVPLIHPATYRELIRKLDVNSLAILAFSAKERAQYGMLEMEGGRVARIVEWKYWHTYPPERQKLLVLCNAGVYAARRITLLEYLDRLAAQPHQVRKQRGVEWVEVQEYFLTDLVELMSADGLPIGIVMTSEEEVTGVDTPESLKKVQDSYARILQGAGATR